MVEKSKYHDPLSESLNIDNVLDVPSKEVMDATPTRVDRSEAMLFDTEEPKAVETSKKIELIPEDEAVRDARRDYKETRARLHQLAELGSEALSGVLEVAQESEHPRAYEVVAQLIKNLADNSEKLMKLHHDMQDLEDKKNKKHETKETGPVDPSSPPVTNNAIFVGSTAELQKMIKSMGST